MKSVQSTSYEGVSSEAIPMDVQVQESEGAAAITATGGARPKVSVAEGSTSAKEIRMLTLIAKDETEFIISRDAAVTGSSKINELLKETDTSLRLDFKKDILGKVVEYLKLKDDHAQGRSVSTEFEIDEEMALEMLAAACFLDC